MKILFLSLVLFGQAFAQNNNITTETGLNNTLMQNAALSQQYQQQAGTATAPPPSINPQVTNPNLNSNGLNLTDQEKQLSQNYVNQAGANQIIASKCSGDMAGICAGQAGKDKFMGIDPAMVQMISKAYAMFSGMSDGKLTIVKKDNSVTDAKPSVDSKAATDTKPETKEETDNCKYIPTVTETLATFTQQQATATMNNAPQSADTAQKDSLLKAAMSHDARAKTAQIQATGWYGGAACYTYMATAGGAVADTKLIVKLGAGFLLGTFFQSEVSNNQRHADDIRAIAASLPGKGDCNPITQKTCYCAQTSNQGDPQYAQYCSPALTSTTPIAATSYRVACTNSNMQIDPTCACTQTNTCFDKTVGSFSAGNALGIGTIAGAPLSGLRSLSRGELTGANITGSATCGGTCAIAKNGMLSLDSKIPLGNIALTPAQSDFAKSLMGKGIPANMAQLMASQNLSKGAIDGAMAKFQGASGGTAYSSGNTGASRSNVIDFSGGNGLGITGKAAGKKTDDFLSKLNMNGKSSGASNSKIMEFAAKAQAQGQILKSDKPLFEIISNRYQESGRRLLEVDAAK